MRMNDKNKKEQYVLVPISLMDKLTALCDVAEACGQIPLATAAKSAREEINKGLKLVNN